jgi:hypothetical protein
MTKKQEPVVKPERVIALWAGESGSGKSFNVACLKNALIFDTDIGGGLAYADARIARNGSVRVEVGSYIDVIEEMGKRRGQMAKMTTVAIDHLSTLHQEAVIRHNPKMIKDFGAAGDKAAKEWRKVRELVRWGDFHLICTAHLKGKWEDEKVVGDQADAAKKIEADFMQVLHVYNDGNLDHFPKECRVFKWRRDPEDARGKVPARFPFTLENFVKIHGYPLEGVRQEIVMASPEQVKELTDLLEVVKIPEETLERWKAKAKAESWMEFPAEALGKCILHVRGLLPKEEAKPVKYDAGEVMAKWNKALTTCQDLDALNALAKTVPGDYQPVLAKAVWGAFESLASEQGLTFDQNLKVFSAVA